MDHDQSSSAGSPRAGAEVLLNVAQRLFLARGYANVSMQAIAEEAGMTKGAPYYHFASKEDLFFRVSQRILEQLREQVAMSLSGEGTLEERVKRSIETLIVTMSVDFSSWMNDVKRELGPERKRCMMDSFGESGDLSALFLPSFQCAAEQGEFSRADPEVAARVYLKLAMACIQEGTYLSMSGLLTPEWLDQTSTEVAAVLLHGIV